MQPGHKLDEHHWTRPAIFSWMVMSWTVMLVFAALVVGSASAGSSNRQDSNQGKTKKTKSAGFILRDDATPEEVGLPPYPGSQRLKEKSDESSAVQLGLWGRSGGFRLVVLKLGSDDAPAKIAAFYRKALSKYGPVLDCSKPDSSQKKASSQKKESEESKALACDDDNPSAGGFLLKAGSKDKQHIVGVEPEGSRAKIALIYLESPGS